MRAVKKRVLLGSLTIAGLLVASVSLGFRRRATNAAPPSCASQVDRAEPAPAEPPAASAADPPAASAAEPAPSDDGPPPATLEEQRQALYRAMAAELDLSGVELDAVKALIDASAEISQGNPAISHHPLTRAQCRQIRREAGLREEPHPPCARRNMVPVYDPGAGQSAADAKVCIDQFEFPGIPCEYPVTYPSAREAALLCKAVGKRLCDAHEWEGACAGALHAPEVEYAFDKPRPYATWLHNEKREIRWAYGPKKDSAICGIYSAKSPSCPGGGFKQCGTNTYPAGSFPACVSPFGVFDQHGNVAEHMNLPLAPEELSSRGGMGSTEMKGSWFAFAREVEPHEHDCRWRAKDWHPSKVMDEGSHKNYHLGFRCCGDVGGG
jgi:formylglycine-generating enzyme